MGTYQTKKYIISLNFRWLFVSSECIRNVYGIWFIVTKPDPSIPLIRNCHITSKKLLHVYIKFFKGRKVKTGE